MRQKLTAIVVQAPQRSPDWFEARLGNVTGSEVTKTMQYEKRSITANKLAQATIYYNQNHATFSNEWIEQMEKYPFEYCLRAGIEIKESAVRAGYRREKVTERITGMQADPDKYISKDMQWGTMQEPQARSFYILINGNRVEEAPLMLHPELMCGASPDGLVIDHETGELGNLEIKCLRSTNHLYKVIKTDEVPEDYIDQIQMQMWITDRDWCDFVAYDSRVKDGLHYFIKRVQRDNFFIDEVLEPNVRRFLDECDTEERQFYAIMNKRLAERKKNRGAIDE